MPGGCAGRGWDGGPSASWAAALALPLPRDSPLPRGRGRPRMPLALRGIPARPGRGSDVGEQAWRGGHRGRGVCASRSCLRSPLRTQGRLGRTQWPKPRAVATGQSHGCGVAGGPFPDIPPSCSGVSSRVSPSPEPAPAPGGTVDRCHGGRGETAAVAGRGWETLVPRRHYRSLASERGRWVPGQEPGSGRPGRGSSADLGFGRKGPDT